MNMYKIVKKGLVLCFGLMMSVIAMSQHYTLEQCYKDAEALSPISRQNLYYASIAELKQLNIKKSNLPQLSFSGQATFQSDVFELPFSIPGSESPVIPRDQYRAALVLQQTIYNGGSANKYRAVVEAENDVNKQQVEVDLYQIKQLLNQLYFGILLNQEKVNIIISGNKTMKSQLLELESLVKNGVLLKSNLYSVKKELLILDQQLIEAESDKLMLLRILEKWVGKEIDKGVPFAIPEVTISPEEQTINRPELLFFDVKSKQIEANKSMLAIRNHPKVVAFANGGVGSPNPYNFFKTGWSEFYMVGVKVQWSVFDYGRKNNDMKMLDYQKDILNSKKDNYLHLTEVNLIKNQQSIQKYEDLLMKDKEIVALQKEVVKEMYSQLNNGVITSTQYLTEVNGELRSQINMKIHELKLIESKIEVLTKSGNL